MQNKYLSTFITVGGDTTIQLNIDLTTATEAAT